MAAFTISLKDERLDKLVERAHIEDMITVKKEAKDKTPDVKEPEQKPTLKQDATGQLKPDGQKAPPVPPAEDKAPEGKSSVDQK